MASEVLPVPLPPPDARLVIPRFGWSEAALDALLSGRELGRDEARDCVFEGEAAQLYAVVAEAPDWLLEGRYTAKMRVGGAGAGKAHSALAHFHSDAHSSPAGTEAASRAPRATLRRRGRLAVLEVELVVSVSNAHVSPLLAVEVSLSELVGTPLDGPSGGSGGSLRRFLTWQRAHAARRLPLVAACEARLVQPLLVTATDAACGSKVCLSVCVENVAGGVDVVLEDLEVHLNRTRYYVLGRRSELATVPLDRYFRLHSDSEALPVRLAPRERHSFVVLIEPVSCDPADLAPISHNLLTLLTVKWSCELLASPVLLQAKAAWSRPVHRALMMSMRFASPVPVNRAFPVCVTVSNHGAAPARDVSVVVLPAGHPTAQRQSHPPRGDIVGVESSVRVGTIPPGGGTRSATIHFIALREGLLDVSGVFLCVGGRHLHALEQVPTVFAVPSASLSVSAETSAAAVAAASRALGDARAGVSDVAE